MKIGWPSELWAAIQVYAIANNKSIGGAWIDGKVGKDTVKWLQSTQNRMAAERRENKEPISESWEKINMTEIWTHNFTPEFNKLWMTKKFQKMGLLSDYGILTYQAYDWSLRTQKGDWRITYISEIDKKSKSIDLRVKRDVNNKVNSMDLAKDIAAKVTAAEKALRIEKNNGSAEKWINDFKNS